MEKAFKTHASEVRRANAGWTLWAATSSASTLQSSHIFRRFFASGLSFPANGILRKPIALCTSGNIRATTTNAPNWYTAIQNSLLANSKCWHLLPKWRHDASSVPGHFRSAVFQYGGRNRHFRRVSRQNTSEAGGLYHFITSLIWKRIMSRNHRKMLLQEDIRALSVKVSKESTEKDKLCIWNLYVKVSHIVWIVMNQNFIQLQSRLW